MATVQKLIDIAKDDLGYKESPANSNQTKYGAWYGMNGQPWCMMAIQYWFHQAGAALPTRTASCTTLMRAAKAAGMWVHSGYRPGDVVIYDWGGDGVPDHCGIVESVNNAQITAIEGNTAVGNDSNGGEVMRRTRSVKQILGAVRPFYMDNTPSASAKEAVEWAVKNGILQGYVDGDLKLRGTVTREQAAVIAHRLFRLLSK